MSFLSKIASIFSPWGKPDALLIALPHGRLFQTDSARARNATQQLYLDARLIIRRSSETHNYMLVAERIVEDGEENTRNLDELFDEDQERAYLLGEDMRFRVDSDGDTSFSWLDLSQGNQVVMTYYPESGIKAEVLAEFVRCVYRAMYERKYSKDAAGVSDEELTAFAEQGARSAVTSPAKPAGLTSPGPSTVGPSTTGPAASTPSKAAPPSGPSTPATNAHPVELPATPPVRHAPVGSTVVAVTGDLYQFDPRVNEFHLRVRSVTVQMQKVDEYKFWLAVSAQDNPLISQPVEQRMNPVFSQEHKSFVWNYFDERGQVWSWSIRFNDATNETAFREMFGQCMWETLNESSWAKVKQEEQQWILDGFRDDVDMEDNFYDLEDEDEEKEKQDEADRADGKSAGDEEEESEEEEEEEEGAGATPAMRAGGGQNVKNSSMAVALATDRSFVVRGDRIGVFKYGGDDDKLQFVTTINDVRAAEGKETFAPSKIMLHNTDRNLLMMKPGDEHNIYKMDLERGKVVEQWKVSDVVPVAEMAPAHKYDQMMDAPVINGLNHNSLFVIDSRVQGEKRVAETAKQYATKQKFSAMATTGQGYVVVGSEKGEIRMFDRVGINAKTLLPGFGDPIIGLDVTEKGDYILATCKDYLLLINTALKGSDHTGFTKRMGNDKPAPIRLKLRPEHVAYMGIEVAFTRARFNSGDGDEKYIVTGTGPYVVTWNFRQVKSGKKLYDYVIKQVSHFLVTNACAKRRLTLCFFSVHR